MRVDNFEVVASHLEFVEDQFYMISIMQRKKDGHSTRDRIIKTYTVRSLDKLKVIENEIKTMCDVFHARAYLSVSRKSKTAVVREMSHKLVEIGLGGVDMDLSTLYISAAESTEVKESKKFIIDVDDDNFNRIIDIKSWLDNNNISYWLNCTVNGIHVITDPFYINKFKRDLDIEIDIKKNARTLLYYNNEASN